MKVLVTREPRLSERFAREVEHLSCLEHPHIVGYVTHGVAEDGAPFLVMPWLEGEDLQARLRRGPLSFQETLSLARAVADALAYLHARGVVHRDLKPSNLFLPHGRLEAVQVIDLGIAAGPPAPSARAASDELVGTPGFIAPELARNGHDATPSADIFSFGCVLFECLTGERLFGGAHAVAVLAKVLLEDAPRTRAVRRDVPDALDDLIQRMVARKAELRPRDGAQLKEWLDDIKRLPPSSRDGMPAITETEQRVVSVLAIVLPEAGWAFGEDGDATRPEATDPFGGSASRFGVRLVVLDHRTAIALAPTGLVGVDQAVVLGRFGRYVGDTFASARVALATGSALAGSRLPVGQAIERAVSIVRNAPPGSGVHVDETSATLLAARFALRHEDDRRILDDERLSLDPTRPLLGHSTSCVGRDRELAVLQDRLAECTDRGPKAALVTAPPGAGKSRLRHELVRRLAASKTPPLVLLCSADPLHMTTPYALLAQAVRSAAGLDGREPVDSVRARLTAYVGGLLPAEHCVRVAAFLGELLGLPQQDDEHPILRAARRSATAMTDHLRTALVDMTRAWSRERSLLLVLEDLHWADAASVRLLDGLLRRRLGTRSFVLALARAEVHERFPFLWRSHDLIELRLAPIPAPACARLVRTVLGDAATQEQVDAIVHESEGNGFYLEELIRDAAQHGEKGTASAPRSLRGAERPEAVLAVAQLRLEQISPEERRILRAASIFGEVFTVEAVSALVGETSPSALSGAIDALLRAEVIAWREAASGSPGGALTFRHTLLQRAAYASLTREDRVLGHRLAARWLESAGEDAELVALHWLEGEERTHAAESFERAGRARAARAQAEAAARCAVRALLAGDVAIEGAKTLLARFALLADTLEMARDIDERDVLAGIEVHFPLPTRSAEAPPTRVPYVVEVAITRSLDALRALGDDGLTALVTARAACALVVLGGIHDAQRALAQAFELAKDDEARLREIRYASAKVSFFADDCGTTTELLSATLLPEDRRERMMILAMFAVASAGIRGSVGLSAALGLVDRADELADDPVAQLHCLKARLLCFHYCGEQGGLADTARRAIALARTSGLQYEESTHLHNLGDALLRQGQPNEARVSLVASDELATELGFERIRIQNQILLAFVDGDGEELRAIADAARGREATFVEMHARYWLGRLLRARDPDRSTTELERCYKLASQLKIRAFADDCAELLAQLAKSTAN